MVKRLNQWEIYVPPAWRFGPAFCPHGGFCVAVTLGFDAECCDFCMYWSLCGVRWVPSSAWSRCQPLLGLFEPVCGGTTTFLANVRDRWPVDVAKVLDVCCIKTTLANGNLANNETCRSNLSQLTFEWKSVCVFCKLSVTSLQMNCRL